MAVRRGYMARRIQGAFRKYVARKRFGLALRKKRAIYRSAVTANPSPTFVETFQKHTGSFVVNTGAGVGQVFNVQITDIPQVAQYANLYKQYRINWMKVMIVPEYNTSADDLNTSIANSAGLLPTAGQARIVSSVQDSPDVGVPATEMEVLQDNGCKIKTIGKLWKLACKPVPNVTQATNVGAIYTRQKYRQWFNFDLVTTGNNPVHGAIQAFITLPGTAGSACRYQVYYKVSFSLRDPQ